MKTVKTRDAATSILRKLGVNSRDYNLFITKNPDGTFTVKQSEALKARAGAVILDLVTTKDITLTPSPVAAAPKPEKRQSISQLAEELLLAGRTNPEVWAELKAKFRLGDDKKHYPSWFRSRLRRQGRLAKREKKS